jgi:hypothetical protein
MTASVATPADDAALIAWMNSLAIGFDFTPAFFEHERRAGRTIRVLARNGGGRIQATVVGVTARFDRNTAYYAGFLVSPSSSMRQYRDEVGRMLAAQYPDNWTIEIVPEPNASVLVHEFVAERGLVEDAASPGRYTARADVVR